MQRRAGMRLPCLALSRRVAATLAAGVLLASSIARADGAPAPGFYARGLAGPEARVYGYGVTDAGGQLTLAAGWAVGPHTALALEGSAHYDQVTSVAPTGRLKEEIGVHLVGLVDHYFIGRRGLHAQLGAGVMNAGFTGGENGSDPRSPVDSGNFGNYTGAEFLVGLGYDFDDVGMIARVETAPWMGQGLASLPVGFFVAASLLYFQFSTRRSGPRASR